MKKFSLSHDWREKLPKINYPKTPKDKLDNLLKTLYKYQKHDGEEVDIYNQVQKPAFWYKHFFKNDFECYYYFKLLQSQNLIDIDFTTPSISEIHEYPNEYQFTLKGLNYYLEIIESGRLSNKCFVAMSFSQETKEIREAIRDALKNTGYDTILVDELHIDSDTTINDKIIAELKGAKFCIADFTEQKSGVYFESGFALGQGKPVIYCCNETDFKNSHFDTKHFAHILYKEPFELKEALVNKINAWIK
jgi:nucleoside 2-deoxyribosyltransferase